MTKLTGTERDKVGDFATPTQLPGDAAQQAAWQSANRAWWESRPMRYDWREHIAAAPASPEYFDEVDKRFLSSVRAYMPWRRTPFEQLIPFDQLRNLDVLEIGVGHGTHAQLLAPRCRSFTGIDLTEHASRMTKARMTLRKLSAGILQMDAEKMAFADSSFDYIWSWGVIHHSADTKRVLQEMNRVLRPNGRCTVMVYYRSWWHFYACGFLRGVFQKRFGTHGNLHHVTQSATDGAIARYYSSADWRDMCRGLFNVDSTEIFGQKSELFPVPAGRLKEYLERMMPDNIGGVMTNTLRMGSFLVAQLHKA